MREPFEQEGMRSPTATAAPAATLFSWGYGERTCAPRNYLGLRSRR